MNEGIKSVNDILSIVINDIHKGKERIFNITESLKEEQRRQEEELLAINKEIEEVLNKVDTLEKKDRAMRRILAKASMNFKIRDEETRAIYDEALNVRVEYVTMQKEENRLRIRRESLQRTLRNNINNIKEVDSVAEQVNVALNYLKGDVFQNIGEAEENNKLYYTIKFVEAQEKERNRIAREVHDGPAQYLASTMMRLDFCKMLLTRDLNRGLAELEDVKGNVQKTLKEVRGIIFDLKPPFLNGVSLEGAIEDLREDFLEETNISLKLNIINNKTAIDYIVEVAVYRIIQEALNNIKKHSRASEAEVKLEVGLEYIYINIKDNGTGFNVEDVKNNSSSAANKTYGVMGIQDRVNELGGYIIIISNINEGTTYKIKLPTIRGKQNDKVSDNR